MFIKKKFKIGNRIVLFLWTTTNFKIQMYKEPICNVKGITSRCEDFKHIIMLDYDGIYYHLMKQELELIQERFKLPPFYIFSTEEGNDKHGQTYGNYGAINMAKHTFKEVIDIQKVTHCDGRYKVMCQYSYYKAWVYRISPKGERPSPLYKGIIGKEAYLDQEISFAHLAYLSKIYDLDYIPYKKIDYFIRLPITTYATASKVTV